MVGWLKCHLGRHDWQQHRNPEVSGAGAVFYLCRRCGSEKSDFRGPSPESGGDALHGLGG